MLDTIILISLALLFIFGLWFVPFKLGIIFMIPYIIVILAELNILS